MKKRILSILLVIVMVASLLPAAALAAETEGGSVTVGNWTDVDPYIPTNSFYNYSKSQTIVPASELTALKGKSIIGMSYYPTSSYITNTTRNVAIYLMETDRDVLNTSFVNASGAIAVYSGNVQFTVNEETRINFNTPYAYSDGNLLVTVLDRTGSYQAYLQFYGVEDNSDAGYFSRYAHTDSGPYDLNPAMDSVPGTGTGSMFRPKMAFHIGEPVAPAHTHAFTYTANNGKITATCTEGCDKGYNTNPLTLTLTAPTSLVYDGNAKAFTFADGEAAAWTGAGLELPTIYYQIKQSGQSTYMPLLGTLKDAGDYMAQITVDGKDAQVGFAIDKATPYIKYTPAPSPIEYGKKLSDSTLFNGYVQVSSTNTTQIGGGFEWTNGDIVPSVSDSNVTDYEVTFTPSSEYEKNYNTVTCQVTITVTHTHNPVKVTGQPATKEAAGWKDYYECPCGALFADENGTTPIENLDVWKAEDGSGYIQPLAPEIYTVTFNMNGHGTQIDPQTVEEGNKATKPSDPTAEAGLRRLVCRYRLLRNV